jgi:hypothetical protein
MIQAANQIPQSVTLLQANNNVSTAPKMVTITAPLPAKPTRQQM